MAIRIITVEREFGSGGAKIAELLAATRGWKLWDTNLSGEIARRANVDLHAAELCDERCDPLLHRLFKVFARGSYERSLPVADAPGFDTDHMVALLHRVIEDVASKGNCVVVGRGSPYILRNHSDAFHVFVYASEAEKLRRLLAIGKSEREACELIRTIDRERAAFIKRYFGGDWPTRELYHLMINAAMGDEKVIETIFSAIHTFEKKAASATA
jgi:cytidylate kinase